MHCPIYILAQLTQIETKETFAMHVYSQRPIIAEWRYRSRLVIMYSWLDNHVYF